MTTEFDSLRDAAVALTAAWRVLDRPVPKRPMGAFPLRSDPPHGPDRSVHRGHYRQGFIEWFYSREEYFG